MIDGDGNENGIKVNRSNWQKNKFARAARLFVFLCRCFARLQCRFERLKRQTSLLHIIFMEELSYVLTQYFVSCVHIRFYFSLPLIFTLLAASISHFFTAAMKFSCFFSQRNSSPLSSITRTSSFSLLST